MWDNLAYFLRAVIPVAEAVGVRMVVHPADPQVPSLAGIARILRSSADYDRLFDLVPSAHNAMVFCLGCFAQMLDSDGVYDAIRHFGGCGRIGYVHFRNVTGTLERFTEVYPDEGKLDMAAVMRIFDQLGYDGHVIPDHTPHGTGDSAMGHRGFAFEIGYMRGLMQAVASHEPDMMATEQRAYTEMDRENIMRALGLDQPLHVQYLRWIGDLVLRGDLGTSLWSSEKCRPKSCAGSR